MSEQGVEGQPALTDPLLDRVRGAKAYTHGEEALLRPEVGTQPQFSRRSPPKSYRFDSSLSPALDWDGNNVARELGEWLIEQIEEASRLEAPHRFPDRRRFDGVEVSGLHDAIERLKAMSGPFLDWAGKAERLSFDVPTLPLFVHERLSTKAILETLKAHERDRQMELQLFGDPQLPIHQQLEAYEHKGGWVNRLILGDSLVVMNSLLEYEGLGGQVQMIYIDPPYGVKFGSNFQPFVRKRDVKHGDDAAMTREPEMVKAYRDTWELGLHSYLSYLRDRLLVARDLLTPSGSLFVQISDENVHHVRELMDEVFGEDNFVSEIVFTKTITQTTKFLPTVADRLIWFARSRDRLKYRDLFTFKRSGQEGATRYHFYELPDGSRHRIRAGEEPPAGGRLFTTGDLTSQEYRRETSVPFEFEGRSFSPGANRHWNLSIDGMRRLAEKGRIVVEGNNLRAVRFLDDAPVFPIGNVWTDTMGIQSRSDPRVYVVQTAPTVVARCILLTTDPGDLVIDPTCGSGTTAYVAEQWGRRWITVDTSRVPLALARQRLLTATFPYYKLRDLARGPAGGFVYKRRQNAKGEELGGIVPHITLKSIADDAPPQDEVLVDRPEANAKITRVTGPFCVEATIPTPVDIDGDGAIDQAEGLGFSEDGSLPNRMLEVLRRSPVLQLPGNRTIALKNVRPPTQSLILSAEAALEPDDAPIALVFGPENGAISEKLVFEAAREAHARNYEQLIVIGFAIEPNARELTEKTHQLVGIPATYVQATPDLVMGDLLKTTRSSQIFSVAGLPDVALSKLPPEEAGGSDRYQVELVGLDVFDPTTMDVDHRGGGDVPAWFLDTAYNRMSFHVSQAFFPRTSAWNRLKKALKGEFEETVWDHLAGTVSAPFVRNGTDEIAVKVIDDRGNELLVLKNLAEAE